jgi:hypothetical protein
MVPFGYYYARIRLVAAFAVVHFALMVMALPGLFARAMSGWRLMFYAEIAALLSRPTARSDGIDLGADRVLHPVPDQGEVPLTRASGRQ